MITRVSLDLMAVKYGVANERSSAVITRVKASPQFSSRQPWPGLSSYGSSALTAPQHPGYREAYAKVSLKKYKPIAARNEDRNVSSGLL